MASTNAFKKKPPQHSGAATNLLDAFSLKSGTKSFSSGVSGILREEGKKHSRADARTSGDMEGDEEEEDMGSDVDEEEL